MAHAHIERLKKRLEASEAASEALREGFAKAVESGTIHPAAAGAELVAAAIRGGSSEVYRKALKEVGVEYPTRESMQAVRKARIAAEEAAPSEDLHDLTTRIRKNAAAVED